ncbi:MAG: MHS family MFS transporter [Saccharopolyspora sp.]|uniref:MFS transporter n=1 Tax=Saccharopolyspora TaxID=1835 RepID=UPI00190A83C8|nr:MULTISPECIES: MFS transporter [unclassified Saccharopolyspora]MBK0868967.1 MHS family MFS transporter [Saccharopolyspora sp. HNM0986]MBQ6640756.1 MHS family MFS transporter [Saccharopolyspora sp.]
MPETTATSRAEHRRIAIAAAAGTTIEWYDFFIYALCAGLVFNTQYFAELGGDALLVSFATIGISFVFRPLGAAAAGHLGDRIGRRGTLIFTLLLMGGSTTLIGAIPPSSSIGVAAPILLVLLRILQGVSAGGEWGGAALLAVEHAPRNRRGLFGAYPQLGAPAGLLLSNGVLAAVSAATSQQQFLAWGWRIPFLLSVVLIAVGWLIRVKVAESPVFRQLQDSGGRSRSPLVAVVRRNFPMLVAGALLFAANNAAGYMTTGGYVQSYAVNTLRLPQSAVLLAVMAGAVVWLVTTLLAGWLSDRLGRLAVYRIGFGIQLVWMFPFFALLDSGNIALLFLALVLYSVGLGLTYGPQAALNSEMFPASVRYSGIALTYATGAVLGGAFAPMIAQALQSSTGTVHSVGAYLAAVTVVGLVVACVLKDRSGIPLTQERHDTGSHSAHPGGARGGDRAP